MKKRVSYNIIFICILFFVFLIAGFVEFYVYADGGTTNYISCGNTKGIPYDLPGLVRFIINLIKFLVPILLILMGAIDFSKVVISNDDKELSKATGKLVKRCIGAVGVFFVILFVQLLLELLGENSNGMMACISCFTSDEGQCLVYEVENNDYSEEKAEADKKREEMEEIREEQRKENEEKAENYSDDNNNNNSNDSVNPGVSIDVSSGMNLKSYSGMNYWELVPHNPRENMGLIVFLHGSGECGNPNSMLSVSFSKFMNDGVFDDYPAIFIAPNSSSCNWVNDSSKVMNLIEKVADEYNIDKNHIVITGHSLGAIGTWHLVNQYPNYFAAAVPVSCCAYGNISASNFKNTPVRAYVGSSEEYLSCMKSFTDSINNNGGNASFYSESAPYNTHISVVNIYKRDELINWMLSQTNKSAVINNSAASKTIYIGDSRTVGMCASLTGDWQDCQFNNGGSYNYSDDEIFIAQGSSGYTWFNETALPAVNSILSNDSNSTYNIVSYMGVNFLLSDLDKYVSKYTELAKGAWKRHNVFLVSVNPVDEKKEAQNGYSTKQSNIIKFNDKIKSTANSLSNFSYCDTYNAIINNFETSDGLHYTSNTYKKIYNVTQNCISK